MLNMSTNYLGAFHVKTHNKESGVVEVARIEEEG